MTRTTFGANAPAMPARRAALGSLIGAGALLAAPRIAAAADLEADPVFAAIERHKASRERFGDTVNLTDEVLARQQGRVITAADEGAHAIAGEAEERDFLALVSTPPQSKAGARALLEYAPQFVEEFEDGLPALFGALLCSPLIAGA